MHPLSARIWRAADNRLYWDVQMLEKTLATFRMETSAGAFDSLEAEVLDHVDTLRVVLKEADATRGVNKRAWELWASSALWLQHRMKDLGRLSRLEAFTEAAISALTATLGQDHQATLVAMSNFGMGYLDDGRPDEAIAVLKPATELAAAVAKGDVASIYIGLAENLGVAYQRAGDHERANQVFDELIGFVRPVLGPDHPYIHTLEAERASSS
jgi:hypothetical protein